MKKFFIISALCCLTACSSSSSKAEDDPVDQPKNVYYNPVINYSLPDPSVIKGEDGYFTYMLPKIFVICLFIVPKI